LVCVAFRLAHPVIFLNIAMPTPDTILQALQHVTDPITGQGLVAINAIKNLSVADGTVAFEVALGYAAQSQDAALRAALTDAAQAVSGVL